ncbi:winged helix-turn-helix transcriptional regulator [Mycobacterium sp. Lab-001]|uniref:winged helix-turn-helix transcriptional regulator n=1 Tax=Mycobacterium sp. Lab-001 TaxID=3410136 RepID=UPI003D16CA3A
MTIDLLGDRLTAAVLREAFVEHTRRFSEWAIRLGAPPAVLSMRLNNLVDAGLMVRRPYPSSSERYDYALTELGMATWEFLVSAWAWEREWSAEGAIQPELVHLDCGHRGPPALMCRHCDRTVTVGDVAVERNIESLVIAAGNGRRRPSRRTASPVNRADLQFTQVMEAIGDRWSALITGLALSGVRRFGEFQSILGISPTTLTDRLSRLTDARILLHSIGRREYALTPSGRGLFGIFAFLISWAQLAYPDTTWNGPRLHHRRCGSELAPALKCRGCNHVMLRTSVRFEPPPWLGADRSTPKVG